MKATENRADHAEALFAEGLNCAQAVLMTFAAEQGLDPAMAARLASGFGGGMGRMAHTCGAVTGAFLVLGLQHGAASGDDKEAKENTYRLVREFSARFEARHGSIACRDLLGCDISTAAGLDVAKQKGLFGTVCPKMVREAVAILEELA